MNHEIVRESRLLFNSGDAYLPLNAAPHVDIEMTSAGSQWDGLHLELGWGKGGRDDMMVNGHFVAMNIDTKAHYSEVREEADGEWVPCTRQPGEFRIQPEGQPFSLRYRDGRIPWAAAIVDGGALDALMGRHTKLTSALIVADPLMEYLFRALIHELRNPTDQPEVTAGLVRAFLLAFGHRHGTPSDDIPTKAGLGGEQLAAVREWITAHLDTRLRVSAIAAHIGLSAVHFSREFKRATGRTPWEYVVQLRLDHARTLLMQQEAVSTTALLCGFFDQAHLTRLFKLKFGCTPAAFAREHGRKGAAG